MANSQIGKTLTHKIQLEEREQEVAAPSQLSASRIRSVRDRFTCFSKPE